MPENFGQNYEYVGQGGELTATEESFIQNIAGLIYQTGDLLYHNGSNLVRLGIGSTDQVLTVSAGLPIWSNSSSAPTNATYITLSTNGDLIGERVLTGTTNQITVTDNGAGSTAVLSTPQNIHTAASPTFAGMTLTAFSGAVSASTGVLSAGTLGVANGGTGIATATTYAVLCGGTTGTGAFQSIAGVGTSGQVLTSNGAGALPTFQNAPGGGSQKIFMSAGDFVGGTYQANSTYAAVRCNDAGKTTLNITGNVPYIPSAIYLVVKAGGTGNLAWYTDVRFAAATESMTTNSDSEGNDDTPQTTAVTINIITLIDITGSFTGIAANDYFGLEWTRDGDDILDTVGAEIHVYGILIVP